MFKPEFANFLFFKKEFVTLEEQMSRMDLWQQSYQMLQFTVLQVSLLETLDNTVLQPDYFQ
jgi:hypothetical protein